MSTDTSTPLVIHGVAGLRERLGTEIGVSDWLTVTQDDVTTFARISGDEQWIHVDVERAKEGPFGGTIVHGYLALGMSTGLMFRMFSVDQIDVILNYGVNKVRFPAPLRVGSRIRLKVTMAEANEFAGGIQVIYHVEYEAEGEAKPPCVADLVWRYYAAKAAD